MVLAVLVLATPLAAQTAIGYDPAAVQKLNQDAQKSGAKILVIESPNAASVTVNGGTGMRTMGKRFEADAFEFRQRFKNILGGAAGFTGETKRTLQRHDPAGGIGWVGIALLLAMAYLALG